MNREAMREVRRQVEGLAQESADWVTFSSRVSEVIRQAMSFECTCWHPVDPGTCLITGSLGLNIQCSGAWLAEHEYTLDDVNKWSDIARLKEPAAALSETTRGDLTLCARFRSSVAYGMPLSDELRVSFVSNGTYWGGAGFIRDPGKELFNAAEVQLLASLSSVIGDAYRRAMLVSLVEQAPHGDSTPGVMVFGDDGQIESISSAAEHLISQLVELPVAATPHESLTVQAVVANARRARQQADSNAPPLSARARTRSGRWLQLYATPLSGDRGKSIAVIIQPAGAHDVVPLVAQAYGLTERERCITRLCCEGQSTREIATALSISEYTVQDHLKSIFRKTGTSSRGELVGRLFLEHYVPRFEDVDGVGGGWTAKTIRNGRD